MSRWKPQKSAPFAAGTFPAQGITVKPPDPLDENTVQATVTAVAEDRRYVAPLEGPGNLALAARTIILSLVLLAVIGAGVGGVLLVDDAMGDDALRDTTVQVNAAPTFAVDTERGDIVVEAGPLGVMSVNSQVLNVDRVRYEVQQDSAGVAITARLDEAFLNRVFSLDEPGADVAAVVAQDAYLDLQTAEGAISATGVGGGGSLRSESGPVALTGASGDWVIETGDGDITVTVTGALNAHIVAETGDGTVTVDGFESTGASFDQVAGDGASTLTLTATSGDIRVIVTGE